MSMPLSHTEVDADITSQWHKKKTTFLIIVIYSLLVGCRYDVGVDYMGYLGWYNKVRLTGNFPVENSEIGYVWLNEILVSIEAHYVFLFIIIAFLQIFFLLKAMERYNFLLPWYFFFFFTSLLMFSSMNIMRQTIAYFLFFYTITLFLDKKYWQVALLVLLGASFHKSILLFVWVYPLLRYDWFTNRYIQIGALVVVTFIASQWISIIIEYASPIINLLGYQYYIENIDQMNEITKDTSSGSGFGKYLLFFIDVFIIFFSTRIKIQYHKVHIHSFYNLYFLGAILERVFAENFILSRTNDYLVNFRVLLLSFVCFHIFKNKVPFFQRVVAGLIVLSMLSYFYRGIDNSAAKCAPFSFFFDY
jgi:hypothetical protein